MFESVLALGRTLIYDLLAAFYLAALLLLVLIPIAAAVGLVHLGWTRAPGSIRKVKTLAGSFAQLSKPIRPRLAAPTFKLLSRSPTGPVITKAAPASSVKAA